MMPGDLLTLAALIVLGQAPSEAPVHERLQEVHEENDRIGVLIRARAMWTYALGTVSAHNSFTGFQKGEELDLREDFGLIRGAPMLDVEVMLLFARRHRLALHSLYGSLSASLVLDRTFEYNDNVFQAGEHARTELDVDLRDLEYAFRVVSDGSLTLWAGAGGRWSRLNAGLASTTLDPAGSREENTALYPSLNASLEYGCGDAWTLGCHIRGSPAAVPIGFSHASLGRFVELRASVSWSIGDYIKLEFGGEFLWLWQRWKGRESDGHDAVNYANIRLLGPSLGLEISF